MKFECQKCGQCCKDFGGGFLPLWEWEADKLKKLAEKNNIVLNLEPLSMLFDKRSRLAFSIQIKLSQEPCPFLVNNRCSIYEERPLVCRCFPLAETPLFKLKGERTDLSSFGKCPNLDAKNFLRELGAGNDVPISLKKKDMIRKYKDVFGEEMFISAFQMDNIKAFVDYTMDNLIKNKKIKLRKISEFDYNKYTAYPFLEFLVKAKLMSEDMKAKMIDSFIDKKRAEDLINAVENDTI